VKVNFSFLLLSELFVVFVSQLMNCLGHDLEMLLTADEVLEKCGIILGLLFWLHNRIVLLYA